MNPRDLFKEGLTIPAHENNDLHYIGEALPAPSLITTAVSASTPAYVGGSAVPAREDHIHNLEFEQDLTNYYTKAEIDAIIDDVIAGGIDLSNYYTKAEIDTFNNILGSSLDDLTTQVNINTSNIDNLAIIVQDHEDRITLVETGPAFIVIPIEKDWSFGHIVNPPDQIFLNRYIAFRDFEIVYIEATYVLASAVDTVIDLWHDAGTGFAVVATVTLAASDLAHQYVFSSPHAVAQGDTLYPAIHGVPTGTGEDITISIRGQYTGAGSGALL